MKRMPWWQVAVCVLLLALAGSAAARADEGVAAQRQKRDAVCTKCHDETESRPILAIYQTPHGVSADGRTPSCQSCHGESEKHLAGNTDGKGRPPPDIVFGTRHSSAGYAASAAATQSEACLTCHKAGLRMHWPGSQHQVNDVPCASCHRVHAASDPMLVKSEQPTVCFTCHKEQRAQIRQISSHPLDVGKMACSDCHNPHGSAGPKLLAMNSVTETCATCHAEKRGPFVHNHQPVVEDCGNCHNPHGTTAEGMLKSRQPFLCQQCHGDSSHPGNVPGVRSLMPNAVSTNIGPGMAQARGCMNCHTNIHGSNSPSNATSSGPTRFFR